MKLFAQEKKYKKINYSTMVKQIEKRIIPYVFYQMGERRVFSLPREGLNQTQIIMNESAQHRETSVSEVNKAISHSKE